jgi:SAM-dependent methyltransferase
MSESLAARYQGSVAAEYDQKRSGSARWRNEVASFEAFLQDVHPARVLDCPFGTGRWIPQYDQLNASVLGVDISGDMLDKARSKIRRVDDYRLQEGSIFDHDFAGTQVDLIVCVRFLNWVPFPDAMRAVRQISRAGSPCLLAGCSVIPGDASILQRVVMRTALALKNVFSRGGKQHVHDEDRFLAAMEACSWRLKEKRFVFSNLSRRNYFYLFSRQ